MIEKIAQKNPTSGGVAAGVPRAGAPNGPQEWQVCWENGVAPKSILARFGHYKISYLVYWTDRNELVFWYAMVHYNGKPIKTFGNLEDLENFVAQRGLPSIRGLPYIFGGE
jgi:hypothetical protein